MLVGRTRELVPYPVFPGAHALFKQPLTAKRNAGLQVFRRHHARAILFGVIDALLDGVSGRLPVSHRLLSFVTSARDIAISCQPGTIKFHQQLPGLHFIGSQRGVQRVRHGSRRSRAVHVAAIHFASCLSNEASGLLLFRFFAIYRSRQTIRW